MDKVPEVNRRQRAADAGRYALNTPLQHVRRGLSR